MDWILHLLLMSLLLAAVASDIRARRIPNALVGAGVTAGLLVNGLLPEGGGLLSSLGGLALGLAVLLPLYLVRAMGAGDVKLMAMVGAFLGHQHILPAVLYVLVAGGVLAIVYGLWRRVLPQALANVREMFFVAAGGARMRMAPDFGALPRTAARLPYAVAIALGVLAYSIGEMLGWGLF
jgi:prepilin peptidase CpaA